MRTSFLRPRAATCTSMGLPMTRIMDPTRDPWRRSPLGHKIWLEHPAATTIQIRDIAAGLSKICRFGGALKAGYFYSVATHCVHVSHLVPPEFAIAGLLHDAEEWALGCDIATPLKLLMGPKWIELKSRWQDEINLRFHVDVRAHEIHVADAIALATERRDLVCSPDEAHWSVAEITNPDPNWRCQTESPERARQNFLWRAASLGLAT
jgi:hypothetical protein